MTKADTFKTEIFKLEDTRIADPLFAGMNETLVWSCLEKAQGAVYVPDREKPESAMAVLGDFCFFAGKADRELVLFKPADHAGEFIIMIPPDEEWAGLIGESYGERARRVKRYAFKKEEHIWNAWELQKIVDSLSEEYTVQMLGAEIFGYARNHEWARDWISQFVNYDDYSRHGLGAIILKDGVPVSGASSYSYYSKGIEIEIDTHPDFRRRGLASVCGAKLILECEKRGLYPSWDAQNLWSAALAKKLGYHFDHEYAAYEILGY